MRRPDLFFLVVVATINAVIAVLLAIVNTARLIVG